MGLYGRSCFAVEGCNVIGVAVGSTVGSPSDAVPVLADASIIPGEGVSGGC